MTLPETGDLFMEDLLPSAAFVLTGLDIYNWGPFGGRHYAEIDSEGTAIIGQTGSGKTTLVDGLMTLITAQPRYNLASTGGHESDRDLISYVRGVSGAGRSGDTDHIARPGKTVSGIAARFHNGQKGLYIGVIFALEGSSSSATDLDRNWLFSQAEDQGLDEWLEIFHSGGKRALKQLGREIPGLEVSDHKKPYLAHLRRFFEVGENAFTLLNRAAGLKQLNSIDELFRELVLDDYSAFERAAEVAAEFDDLAAIHEELEIAHKQRQSLLPVEQTWSIHQEFLAQLTQQRDLLTILPIWYALGGHRLWSTHASGLNELLEECERRIDEAAQAIQLQGQQEQVLRDGYLQTGGNSVELLKQQIITQRQLCEVRGRDMRDYQRLVKILALDPSPTREALLRNQQNLLDNKLQRAEELEHLSRHAWDMGIKNKQYENDVNEVKAELQQVRSRPGSNIPTLFQQFRHALAEHLGSDEAALPFVAELIQVRPEETEWRGAIERAIGGHRLRLMVPTKLMKSALDWVNSRDNHLHVRLLEVKPNSQTARCFEDGFTQKLKLKQHPCSDALKQLLSDIDRHCVASPEVLKFTPHGMTAQGLMSGKSGFFEKQDKSPLAQGWMTGFDNSDLLASLNKRLEESESLLQHQSREFELAKSRSVLAAQQVDIATKLADIQFEQIDLPKADQELKSLEQNLEVLTDPQSDTAKALQQWEESKAKLTHLHNTHRTLGIEQDRLARDRKTAIDSRERAFHKIGAGLSDAQQLLGEAKLDPLDACTPQSLVELQADAEKVLRNSAQSLAGQLATCETKLVRQMVQAKKEDTGALAEVGSEMADVPQYLERLRVLTEEALPEKQRRFLSYLNQSSDQGVTQLLGGIDNQVSIIEERIEDLNSTMRRVDYQAGRYLRLEPKRVIHESLKTLQQAQRALRAAALQDDQGESHFSALAAVVALLRDASERKTTVGAKALLDPRYRLQFAVSVIERDTGSIVETRTGSQGGSGGEKEIIASYILTASLSYALCPDGSSKPLFGTVVLDEAFSKSSQAVAGRIISALREFGLHPLFVTPNKEMGLLRSHTRSAILVHRKGLQATLTSLSWAELDDFARKKKDSLR